MTRRLGFRIAMRTGVLPPGSRQGFNPDDLIGLELDDVLEGPDEVPLPAIADREAQVIRLPPLTAEERAAQVAADDAARAARRTAGDALARQYEITRDRAEGRRITLPSGMPRPTASLTSTEVDDLVGGWPADPRWHSRHLSRSQAAALDVLRQRKHAAVREVIERHLATRSSR